MNVGEIYYRKTQEIISFYFIEDIKENNLLRKRISIQKKWHIKNSSRVVAF